MGAVKELWWVIIMIGGPALCVVLWEQHKHRKYMKQWRALTDWQAMGEAINEGVNKGYANQVAQQRQKHLDDHTFKTVEEYRDESD